MIAFSYELSRRESKMGTPERPISDLGLVSYRSYWVYALLEILHKHRGSISVQELSERTAFRTDDIDAFKRHLDAHGVQYADYGTRFARDWHQIFFLDPEGVIIEVHAVLR